MGWTGSGGRFWEEHTVEKVLGWGGTRDKARKKRGNQKKYVESRKRTGKTVEPMRFEELTHSPDGQDVEQTWKFMEWC